MNRYRRHAEAQKSKQEAPMHSDDAIYFVSMSDGNLDDYEFSSPAIKRWKSANSEERNSLTGGRRNGLQHHNHNNHHHTNGVVGGGGVGKSWHREPVVGSRTANGRKISFRSQNKDPVLTELNGQDEEVSVTARITSCMVADGGDLSLDSHGSYYQDDGFIFATNDLTLTTRGNGLAIWTASTARGEATETTEVTLGPEGDNNYVLDKPEIPPEFSLSGAGEAESYVTTEIVDHPIVEEEAVVTENIVGEEPVMIENVVLPTAAASVPDEGAVVVNSDSDPTTNYNDLLILNDPVTESSSSSQVAEQDPDSGAGESSGAYPVADEVSGEPQEDANGGGVSVVEMNGIQYVVLKIGEKTILIPSDTYKEYIDAQETGDEEKAAEFIRQVQAACVEETEQGSVEPETQTLFESIPGAPVATPEEQPITETTVTRVPVDEQLPESVSHEQQVSIDDQGSEPVSVGVVGQRLPDCPDLDAM